MSSLGESIAYFSMRAVGRLMCALPLSTALMAGRGIGLAGYYFDCRHKMQVYSNLKSAFSKTKSPQEIKAITKEVFKNFGQNLVELMRLPVLTREKYHAMVTLDGRENIFAALEEKKGVILLAMHFGSWELASLACAMIDCPYKVIVNPQKRNSRLDELLNSYRECGGSVVLSRGFGTRELIRSLKNNEAIGMVVDQGGKEGEQIPFFGRLASMSSGAVRLALKWGVPLCFSVIYRERGPQHRLIVNQPLVLQNTGDENEDVRANLTKISGIMEQYITEHPAEYMWFYKIWKYSKEATVVILSDGKMGHLRQSESVAKSVGAALNERQITSEVKVLEVQFQSRLASRCLTFFSLFLNPFLFAGRLEFLKRFLTEDSYRELMALKADFIISCGSQVSGLNFLFSKDNQAKSVAVLKPGPLSFRKFDLVVLPQHDSSAFSSGKGKVVVTKGAPNLVTPEYLSTQSELLLKRFSHLKNSQKMRIGVLIGGDNKNYELTEDLVKVLTNQLKEVAEQINADILLTTSRRTSAKIENSILRELKKHPRCQLLIVANRMDVPEAMGGILGLSDIVIVSGDSISMISESATSGKNTIVFPIRRKKRSLLASFKHEAFIEQLNEQGYIVSSSVHHIAQSIHNIAKNKIHTRRMDDGQVLLAATRELI